MHAQYSSSVWFGSEETGNLNHISINIWTIEFIRHRNNRGYTEHTEERLQWKVMYCAVLHCIAL